MLICKKCREESPALLNATEAHKVHHFSRRMKGLIVLVTLLVVVASAPVKEERNQIRHRLYSSKVCAE